MHANRSARAIRQHVWPGISSADIRCVYPFVGSSLRPCPPAGDDAEGPIESVTHVLWRLLIDEGVEATVPVQHIQVRCREYGGPKLQPRLDAPICGRRSEPVGEHTGEHFDPLSGDLLPVRALLSQC